ncbi:hypothetical protein DBZ36_11430 [Alginatibacterium sediminis]|uniref:Solute-binding protein family 3/N-terminal domain-containing protein n=1 Tax=Alginatibacterium sediminis TaxID=2164068 RepID=A0A420EB05_9ALTE|nr:transporter substrate-binding domain-containing protein [Alginatibacterium sediminis]RKF17861.1 hypothetical protein DBZ36_11430 [Alginatibacterium sediminis]
MHILKKIVSAALLSLTVSHSYAIDYFTENLAPYNYYENGRLSGISIDLLRLVWEELGEQPQQVQMMEWSKAYYLTQYRPNTALFLTMRNPKREDLFQWACPIMHAEISLFSLKENQTKWDGSTDLNQYQFAVVSGSVGEQLLLEKGVDFENIHSTDEFSKAVTLLKRARVDAIASEQEVINIVAPKIGINPASFKNVYLLGQAQGCFAFNLKTDPKYIAKFEAALQKIVATPEYQEIRNNYGL